MEYLIDTHTLLWYFQDDARLSLRAKQIIDTCDCVISYASLWEIAIKQSIGKLQYNRSIETIENDVKRAGFKLLQICSTHLDAIKMLPFIHNDPFDRLLIAQATVEHLAFITADTKIKQYQIETVW